MNDFKRQLIKKQRCITKQPTNNNSLGWVIKRNLPGPRFGLLYVRRWKSHRSCMIRIISKRKLNFWISENFKSSRSKQRENDQTNRQTFNYRLGIRSRYCIPARPFETAADSIHEQKSRVVVDLNTLAPSYRKPRVILDVRIEKSKVKYDDHHRFHWCGKLAANLARARRTVVLAPTSSEINFFWVRTNYLQAEIKHEIN